MIILTSSHGARCNNNLHIVSISEKLGYQQDHTLFLSISTPESSVAALIEAESKDQGAERSVGVLGAGSRELPNASDITTLPDEEVESSSPNDVNDKLYPCTTGLRTEETRPFTASTELEA